MGDNTLLPSDGAAATEPTNTETTTVATESTPVQESAAATNVDFVSTLSEDLQGLSNLKDFKDANQLAKSYVELQRMVGNSVRIPAADASEEARADFLDKIKDVDGVLLRNDEKLLNKLGKPETTEGYKLEELVKAEIAESIPGISEELNSFKDMALDIGLTDVQAQKLVEMRMGALEAQQQASEASFQKGTEELRKLWGQDFDNRAEAAKSMINTLHEKHGDAVDQLCAKAGDNPVLMHMFAELAESYKEKGHEGMSSNQFGLTPEMALQKIADKRADRGFMKAYHDDLDPGHKQAVAEMQKLYGIANGAL